MMTILTNVMESRVEFFRLVLVFFTYSFLGCIMECIVLTVETKKLVTNRGFTAHLPFCIIYGFGAVVGYHLLAPYAHSIVALYFVGAFLATGFELIVGTLQMRLFGAFWWDYSEKSFNYRGILCLESTLAWGIVAVVIVRYLHVAVTGLVNRLPAGFAAVLAVALLLAYASDFALCAYNARREKNQKVEQASEFNEELRAWK